jgi:predicted Zn-dependent peptidase
MDRTRSLAAIAALALAIAAPAPARAGAVSDFRRSSEAALDLEVERIQLANGLVVLLSPDPTVSSVAVWMTFRAGAQHEPPGRSGLAHLVEHVMASGPTPETGYTGLLERRRARFFNATTGFDTLSFEVVVPPEELPVALWVAADRLATLPALVDATLVERHRRVVMQERALVSVDAPYGLVREHLFERLFAAPHPLHAGVLGTPAELASIGADDVRRFVEVHLAPANAVLAIVGRFDPAVARRLLADGLERLPAGRRVRTPALPPPRASPLVDQKAEPIAREPRVTMAWRFQDMPREHATALELGAQLLTFLTDGAWGMRIAAGLHRYSGESIFTMELTVPYDEPGSVVGDDADGFLRFLTHREMPVEHLIAANLALDRFAMLGLDTVEGRAQALTTFELLGGSGMTVAAWLGEHWDIEAGTMRDVARAYLRRPRVVLHARPVRPRPARLERE